MALDEFRNEFEILYNNITSNQAPGLDDYEKSVFLTKALEELLKAYFNSKGNKFAEGFDDSAKRQIDFSMLILTRSYESNKLLDPIFDQHSNSSSIELPSNIMTILNELVLVSRNSESTLLLVIPINYSEYETTIVKPYTRPLKNQAWRLIVESNNSICKADLVVGYKDIIEKYIIRYIRYPKPIILSNLEGLSIEGENTATECELHPSVHREILLRAVELAKAAYIGNIDNASNLASMIQLGSVSATNLGISLQLTN